MKGTSRGSKRGAPMSTVTWPESSTFGRMMPAAGLHGDLALVREPLVQDEAREAARAVAALLDLAAVGVVDAIAEVVARIPRGLDDEDLVAAHAEMAIGDAPHRLLIELHALAHAVQDHEIVALALHLGEPESGAFVHGPILLGAIPFRGPGSVILEGSP
jgi:hypothetical protein